MEMAWTASDAAKLPLSRGCKRRKNIPGDLVSACFAVLVASRNLVIARRAVVDLLLLVDTQHCNPLLLDLLLLPLAVIQKLLELVHDCLTRRKHIVLPELDVRVCGPCGGDGGR